MLFQKKLFFIGITLLATFVLFSWQVKRGFGKQIDFAVTVKVQDTIDRTSKLRTKALVGDIMEGATFFANPEFSVVWVLGLTVIAVVDFKKKKIRWKGFVILVLFLLLVLAELYGKSVVHHPAPPFFMIKNPTTIFPKYYINEQFSYPSGHAARAVFLALCSFSFLVRKSRKIMVGIGLFCYVGLVSVSRIYLGHHWLSDIFGGVLLGSSLGLGIFLIMEKTNDKFDGD